MVPTIGVGVSGTLPTGVFLAVLLLVSGPALGMRTLAIKALRTVSMNLVPGPLSDLGVSPELSPTSEPKNSRVLSRNASHKVVNKEVRVLDCNQTFFRVNYIVTSSCKRCKIIITSL